MYLLYIVLSKRHVIPSENYSNKNGESQTKRVNKILFWGNHFLYIFKYYNWGLSITYYEVKISTFIKMYVENNPSISQNSYNSLLLDLYKLVIYI